jgi:hypothetical protein
MATQKPDKPADPRKVVKPFARIRVVVFLCLLLLALIALRVSAQIG